MKLEKQLFYLRMVRESLSRLFSNNHIDAYLHVSEIHKSENCLYYEIEAKTFNSSLYDYLYDESDSLEVVIYPNKTCLFKLKYIFE